APINIGIIKRATVIFTINCHNKLFQQMLNQHWVYPVHSTLYLSLDICGLDDKPFWMTGEAWGHGVMQRAHQDRPSAASGAPV
ncbi:hypothetical protein O5559_27865, partial [Escherichia coli]|nr:hypothetical protein [Escherichia coli]